MTKIILDFNSDEVIIVTPNEKDAKIKIKREWMSDIQILLYEVINAVYDRKNVSLVKIDEENTTTIEEW